jgi:hypothetical protein
MDLHHLNKMMQIEVTFDIITPTQTKQTIDYYNQHKPVDWNEIEKNDVAEGGFCIPLKTEHIKPGTRDINDKIKQVRWNRKKLVSWKHYKSLEDTETQLLYQALCNVFGDEYVKLSV